jgi:N-acyl-D-amino-acid deacylase
MIETAMRQSLFILLNLACCQVTFADDLAAEVPSPATELSQPEVRAAIQMAIPLLQHGATVSARERKCFTCHNQALPVIALTEFSRRGFDVDREILQRQIQHTWDHLDKGKTEYLAGNGQGGQVMTAGYAMWALEIGGWKADETTAAVAHYLVEYQKDKNRWLSSSQRLPSMGSPFTATYVALRALSHYGTDEHADGFKARREAAAKWVLENEPRDTEDRVFRLRTLPYLDAEQVAVQTDIDELLAKQQADGGWSQSDEMTPDAYATGTVLTALQEVGRLPCDHPAIVSGCRYLLKTRKDDGTWHVITHAKPIQTYYESGFPHGTDQFISITATAWAALALAGTLSEQ